MKFGYVWRDPRAISEKDQAEYLANCERVVTDRSPDREGRLDLIGDDKPKLRKGDTLSVYRTRYLADDTLDFFGVIARLAEIGAALHVVNLDVTFTPDKITAAVMKRDVAERHKAQTAAATEAWRKLPKARRGGRKARKFTPEEKKKFKEMWAAPAVYTLADMAEVFGCAKPSITRYAEAMKLPPRGA